MRRAQYSATYRAVELEKQSYTRTLDRLARKDTAGALEEVRTYQNRDEVVGQLATLPLVAGPRVLQSASDLLKARSVFLDGLATLAASDHPTPNDVRTARTNLALVEDAEGDLLVAMRLELDIS
jgi:hypothetical protein